MPDGAAGSTHSPETSVSSEIEFCGIAPRLPRKISIKFHQVRRSSATTRWATLYHTWADEDEGPRSFARSVYLSPIDLIRGRSRQRYQLPLDLPEIRSSGIPKIQAAVELSGQCDPSNPIERRCISRGSKIERVDSAATPTWSTRTNVLRVSRYVTSYQRGDESAEQCCGIL